MFSDLGSKKTYWIPCVRQDGGVKEEAGDSSKGLPRIRPHLHQRHTYYTVWYCVNKDQIQDPDLPVAQIS